MDSQFYGLLLPKSISMLVKVFFWLVKALLSLVVLLLMAIGYLGEGWGAKPFPKSHQFYTGDYQLIAHRGVAVEVPENSFESAKRAVDLGFKSIELDIKQSRDQSFYLFHDRNSTRLFGAEYPLNEMTLSELQQVPLLIDGERSTQHVPELKAFSEKFSSLMNFYLDLKRHGNYQYGPLAARIYQYLQQHNMVDRSFIGSDFLFTVYLEYRYPDLHTVFTGPGNWLAVSYLWIPKRFRPDFFIGYANEVTLKHLEWLNDNELINRRMLYGVNGANYHRVKQWGVPILMVDYDPVMDPDLIARQ